MNRDWYAVSAQIAQVCQLMTVYPLLVLIIRTQVFELLYRDAFPGRLQVTVLSIVVMGTTLVFALFVPNVCTPSCFPSGPVVGTVSSRPRSNTCPRRCRVSCASRAR